MACLDNNNKDGFYVVFLLSHTLKYIFEETLGEKCIFHHGYMNKILRYETYVHFFNDHNYKTNDVLIKSE